MLGGLQIDLCAAFYTFVLTGLLVPVIMAPPLDPIRDYASWVSGWHLSFTGGCSQGAEPRVARGAACPSESSTPPAPPMSHISPSLDLRQNCLPTGHLERHELVLVPHAF